ncbi:hypothetical protein OC842_002985 [Tilletia horrida]|uniref:Amine oxidase n=1 Tax=Tilletia horrida TaxID=155126 RepID=A0AAN6GF12_9BASI|nr:hypothetical protein OC842_002985 [Tilletia horrida]
MRFSLTSTALVLAALALPSFGQVTGATYDAVIIGGGLSGLSAAKTLAAAGKSYIVLEARDRTGGRVHNAPIPGGGYTEVGAEFLGPTQDYALALAKELGLQIYETYNTGKNVYYNKGYRGLADANSFIGQAIPSVDPISLLQLLTLEADLDKMAKSINVERPWNSSKAAAWDSKTFGAWLDGRGLTSAARAVMDTATTAIFSAEAPELSLLYTIAYIASSGNATTPGTFERLTSTGGDGSQRWRVVGGTELLATKLADKLGRQNIVLGAPVQTVKKVASAQYTTTLRNGTAFSSRSVIVAMSPPIAGRINYDPPLPAARDQLCQRMQMGSIGKVIATYKTPFWRKAGLTGQAVSGSGTTRTTFDQSLDDGSVYALMGFVEANEMRKFDSATVDELTASVTQDFINYFGPEAANVTSYVTQRWDLEEFSRGGPVAWAGPGVLTQLGPALRTPVDGIHFAGTESATYWVGYMSGALESGERAAKEVIAKL